MILPDARVLVYAFRESAPELLTYSTWLDLARQRGDELLLPDAVLTGFLRIVTHPGIPVPRVAIDRATAFVSTLRESPSAREVEDPGAVWTALARLIADDPGPRPCRA